MQRTILPPVQPLGGPADQITNETSTSRSRHVSSNLLIVEGGSMAIVPVVNSTSVTPRPANTRCFSTGSISHHGLHGQT